MVQGSGKIPVHVLDIHDQLADSGLHDQLADSGWSSVSFDDPVPADSGVFREVAPNSFKTHTVESQVQRKLLSQPNLQFSSLVVRRLPNGVCLEGVLETTDGSDLCKLARQVEGVQQVLNRLVVRG